MMKTMWKRLSNKEYRDAFISSKIDNDLSAQIYALREQRALTQGELGQRAGMAQPRIAKLERSCDGVSLATLKRLAAAFDVGLSVRFVPYSELLGQSARENLDKPLPAFVDDKPPAENFSISLIIPYKKSIPYRPQVNGRHRSITEFRIRNQNSILIQEKFGAKQSSRL